MYTQRLHNPLTPTNTEVLLGYRSTKKLIDLRSVVLAGTADLLGITVSDLERIDGMRELAERLGLTVPEVESLEDWPVRALDPDIVRRYRLALARGVQIALRTLVV